MNIIRKLRIQKGITQEELGNILSVQKSAISKYELGRSQPSNDVLRKLSQYFNVSADYILGTEKPSFSEFTGEFVTVPVVGEIHKDMPIVARENIIGEELIPKSWINNNEYFVLEVSDDTMIDVGILLGGKALIQQQSTCGNGAIAVVMLDGESAALRRVFLHPERDEIELVPENRKYPRMYYPASKIKICGIVKKVWQDF